MLHTRQKRSAVADLGLPNRWLCVSLASSLLLASPVQAQEVIGVAPSSAGLGSAVTVTLEMPVPPPGEGGESIDPDDWIPFLGDTPVIGSQVVWVSALAPDATMRVRFVLLRDASSEDSRAAWRELLQGRGDVWKAQYPLSVGTDETGPFRSRVEFTLEKLRPKLTWFAGILLVALIVGFVVLVFKTSILRVGDRTSAFSLGRSQMAWWTFLVIGSFFALWLSVGELSVSPSALVLLGISGTTGLAAVSVRRDLGKPSHGFWRDILSDQKGQLTLHRFQMWSWTLILGLVYVVEVWTNHSVPIFDSTLLTLMGISSGTYVGFKFPEAQKPRLKLKSPQSPVGLAAAQKTELPIQLETGPDAPAVKGVNTTSASDDGRLERSMYNQWKYTRGTKAADEVTLEFSLVADPDEKVTLIINKTP
jgi:hypothetical protein